MSSQHHPRRLYIGTTAERTAFTPPADGQGITWYDTDFTAPFWWNGAAWGIYVKPYQLWESDGGAVAASADAGGVVTFASDIIIDEYLIRVGDADTFIRAQDDRWDINAGGVNFVSVIETAQNIIVINDGVADIDIRVESATNQNAIFFEGSSGKVGLGTATIPHGGIGVAMLALEGPNASSDGPHVQFTTASDDYPVMHMLMFSHDNMYPFLMDCYYDGSVFKSSDAGSNTRIFKSSDQLKIDWATGYAQGAAITWGRALTVALTSGNISIGPTTTPKATTNAIFQVLGSAFGSIIGYAAGISTVASTVIADGAPDVTIACIVTYIIQHSDGTVGVGQKQVNNNGNSGNLVVGAGTFQFQCSAAGVLTFIRTAGTGTGTYVCDVLFF